MQNLQEIPLCDEGVLEILGGDDPMAVLGTMIPAFLDDAAIHIEKMCQNTQPNSIKDLGDAAHKLAGVSASFGAVRLQKVAQEIDAAAKTGKDAEAITCAPMVPPIYEETKTQFEAYLRKIS